MDYLPRRLAAACVAAASVLASCSGGGPSGPPSPAALTIVETTPAQGANAVPVGATVAARFGEAVDPSTLQVGFVVGGIAGAIEYDPATFTATLRPAAPLAWATTYTATISTSVRAASGRRLAAAYVWSFTTQDDPAPFHVVDVTPPDGGTLPRTGVPNVRFSRPVDAATLGAASFSIGGVPGAVAYDASTRTATFTPSAPLAYDTAYTARVEATVADTGGVTLAAPFTWSFRTPPDTDPPAISARTPAPDATAVALDAAVSATFSEDMAPGSIGAATFTLAVDGGAAVPATVSYDAASRTATLAHPALAAETAYAATISGATDVAGNALPATTWRFTTVGIPPAVVAIDPPDGARAVGRLATHPLTVIFSEPMAPATLGGAVTLSAGGVPVPGTVAWDGARLAASFTPAADLLADTVYSFAVAGTATDVAGIPLAAPASVQFRTAGVPHELTVPSAASHVRPALAVSASGDALAAWFADSGTGYQLLAARYAAATGAWSAEEVLETSATGRVATGGVSVVATDEGFAVVWSSPTHGLAAMRLGAGGWSATETIASAPVATTRWQVATDGRSIAVAWSDGTATNGTLRLFDGTGWRSNWNLLTGRFELAGCSTGIGVLTVQYTTTAPAGYSIWFREWRRASGAWAADRSLAYVGSSDYKAGLLDLVTNGRSYMALWDRIYSGGLYPSYTLQAIELGVDAPADAPIQSIDGQVNWAHSGLATASDGAGYAVAWDFNDTFASSHTETLKTASFAGGTWTNAAFPSTYEFVSVTGLASNGSGYALTWTSSTGASKLYAALGSGGTWGDAALIDEGSGGDGIGGGSVGRAGSEYVVAYAANGAAKVAELAAGAWTPRAAGSGAGASAPSLAHRDGHAIAWWLESNTVRAHALGPVGWATANLVQGDYPGSVLRAKVVVGATATLVVWTQHDAGVNVAYASIGRDGSWSEPFRLSGAWSAGTVDAAARGGSFVASWSELYTALRWRVHDGTSWGATTNPLPSGYSGGDPRIAVNASGYLVAYANRVASTFSADGISWSVPVGQASLAQTDWAVAGSASGFAILMWSSSGGAVQQTTFDANGWSLTTKLATASAMGALATDGASYLFAWPGTGGVSAARFDGAAWSPAAALGAGSAPACVDLAPEGYMVTWDSGGGTPAYRTHAQGAWTDAGAMPGGAAPARMARVGTVVAAIGVDAQAGAVSRAFASGRWSTATALESEPGTVAIPGVASNGANFAMAWGRTSPGAANRRLFAIEGM